MGRARQAFWLTCLGVLLTRPVGAEDPSTPARARLEWTRSRDAEHCVDGPGLEAAVNQRWQRQVFVDDATANIVVKGSIGRDRSGGWSVRLELEHPDGTKLGSRKIVTRAPECSSLDDSVALALGLMLDLTERKAPPAESAPIPSAPPSSATPITIPKETLAPRAPWQFDAALGGEAAVGIVPGMALGGRLMFAFEPPQFWRVELGGTFWAHRTAGSDTQGAELSMWTLDFAICPISMNRERFSAAACIAQRAGKIGAQGKGFDSNAAQDETYLAAEARAGAGWKFAGPFVLRGAFGLAAPFVRFRFVYRDELGEVTSVYRMAPVAGVVTLGIGARF